MEIQSTDDTGGQQKTTAIATMNGAVGTGSHPSATNSQQLATAAGAAGANTGGGGGATQTAPTNPPQ